MREELNLEETRNGYRGSTDAPKRRYTYLLSLYGIAGIVAVFAFCITFAVLLTYNFGICSNINVQSEVCDKKNVIPISIVLNNSAPATVATPFEEDLHLANRTNIRLPKTMHPISYELKLIPFLFEGNFTFQGDVRIVVNVTASCKNITLHSVGLRMKEVQVWKIETPESRKPIIIADRKVMPADQFFVIIFATDLEANSTYEIDIKYNGTLNENLQGFYRSSYEVKNTTR